MIKLVFFFLGTFLFISKSSFLLRAIFVQNLPTNRLHMGLPVPLGNFPIKKKYFPKTFLTKLPRKWTTRDFFPFQELFQSKTILFPINSGQTFSEKDTPHVISFSFWDYFIKNIYFRINISKK